MADSSEKIPTRSPSEVYILLRDCDSVTREAYDKFKTLVNTDAYNDWDIDVMELDLSNAIEYLTSVRDGLQRKVLDRVINKDYVNFGDVSRDKLGLQCQYGKRYLDPDKYPDLSEDIRIKGALADYHALVIHKDDVDKFVTRTLKYLKDNGIK